MRKIVTVQLISTSYEMLFPDEDIVSLKNKIKNTEIKWIYIDLENVKCLFKCSDFLYMKVHNLSNKSVISDEKILHIWFTNQVYLKIRYDELSPDCNLLDIVTNPWVSIKTKYDEWFINSHHIQNMYTEMIKNISKDDLFNNVNISPIEDNKNDGGK